MKYLLQRKVAVEQVKDAAKLLTWFCDLHANTSPYDNVGQTPGPEMGSMEGKIHKNYFVTHSLNFCLTA